MEFGIWGVGEMALRVRVGGGWRVAGGGWRVVVWGVGAESWALGDGRLVY